MSKNKLPKEMQHHCQISVTATNLQTGERRELSQEEIAERLQKVFDMPLEERMKISLRRAG